MRYTAMTAPSLVTDPVPVPTLPRTGCDGYDSVRREFDARTHERLRTLGCGAASAKGSGRELHAGVGVAAVAERVLCEVLLVLVLGVVVRRLAGRPDLGRDVTEPAPLELVAVHLGQVTGDLLLLGGSPVDRRAVLRADVVALAEALGRVVDLEERLHQVGEGHLRRVEDDP